MIERKLAECPKCGARGGCAKHGLTSTGIDMRNRGVMNRAGYIPRAELDGESMD